MSLLFAIFPAARVKTYWSYNNGPIGIKSAGSEPMETTRAEKKFSRYFSKKIYFSNMFSPKPPETMAMTASLVRSTLQI